MRGRKPLATEEKKRRGTAQKNPQRINKHEPIPPPGAPTKPKHLDKIASEKWDHVIEILDEMSMMNRADADLIEAYCVAYSGYRAALVGMTKSGMVLSSIKDSGDETLYSNPYATQLHKFQQTQIKLLSEMGLTPASRCRIHAKDNDKEADPLFEILRGSLN